MRVSSRWITQKNKKFPSTERLDMQEIISKKYQYADIVFSFIRMNKKEKSLSESISLSRERLFVIFS